MASGGNLETLAISTLRGVGVQSAARLEKLAITTVADLLFHLPIRYEDRTRIIPIRDLVPGQQALVEGRIDTVKTTFGRRRILVCQIDDGNDCLTLRFFYFSSSQQRTLRSGLNLRCFGEVRSGYQGLEMIHPEYECIDAGESFSATKTLTPVYPLTQGIRQPLMRKLVDQSLQKWVDGDIDALLVDWIPATIRHDMDFPSLHNALTFLHSPPADVDIDVLVEYTHPAQQRFIFEELMAHYLCLNNARQLIGKRSAPVFSCPQPCIDSFLVNLGFELTKAQRRVIDEIHNDYLSGSPMMRLIHGDVGAGKTVVAACGALAVLQGGYQVALMVPTELLAEQHFKTMNDWFQSSDYIVGLLSGSQSDKEKSAALQKISSGEMNVVIGTHALFQEAVNFFRLGLVIIDEQHRFGVQQRLALRDKGLQSGMFPHQLIMTATPIPRTLAMLRFADMDVSVLDELPPGRVPVKTSVVPARRRDQIIERIAEWVNKKRQVYWVCTLIEESELFQCEAVEETLSYLQTALPGARVAMVHGKLKVAEKDATMLDFVEHRIDVLVATTVIEVGVNVPNADLMIIENPERLGLAQLHQLRGRVGRGAGDSYCLLVYQSPLSDMAKQRLSILRQTSDGFKIAEKDLQLRGPGEVLGTRQTGQIPLKIANLVRDKNMVSQAVRAAEHMHKNYPEMVNPMVSRWVGDASQYTDV